MDRTVQLRLEVLRQIQHSHTWVTYRTYEPERLQRL
jgi:hypothetical protein